MNFVHLHVHTHYSLLDGLTKLDDLIAKAVALKMPAVTITDHGTMYGAVEFYTKAKKAGIKPIVGVECYVARDSRHNKDSANRQKPYHLVLLAKDNVGYHNLIKLTTIAHLEGFYYKPRVDWEVLEKYHEGLIALSACIQGEVAQAIIENNLEKAEKVILKYQKTFGKENFYLEVQHHPGVDRQAEVNEKIIALGKKMDAKVVATNDSHYLNSDDADGHDVLLCLQTKHKKNDENRMSMLGDDFSFFSGEEMASFFPANPEVISNTLEVAEKCNLEIELGVNKLPKFDVPDNLTDEAYLSLLCQQGIEKKYRDDPTADFKVIDERLEYELGVIEKTGFASYFLIVQDFVTWAKNQGIVVGPGRGSAAGSIVSYLLDITTIDPLKYNLLFERFLNPERISMPDIDLDFADVRRQEVIEYVEKKYGRDHVSQIITFGTMAARAAVRDAGRVLDYAYDFCDKIAKLIPMFTKLKEALETVPDLRDLYNSDPQAKHVIDMAKKLEGVARHASTHACGVLITPKPIDEYVPAQYASSSDNAIVCQYEMTILEKLGLLKMDFLGLKNLTLIQNAIKKIKITTGIEIDLIKIPLEDEKTFKLLQEGKTTGVFQLESAGMKRYLKQLKPTLFEDIIAMVALYRPGPMDWIPDYIDGKHGKKTITYLDPRLEPILKPTYGIAVYQEQVLQMARDVAGFTLGEADILRKAVGKKIVELLAEQKIKFVNGCVKNGLTKETGEKLFSFIEPFAGYGFNKSHAACYAMIAYQTAYLKANYPTEFMAALLIADQGDNERIAIEIEEAKSMGIKVLPPDINESFKDFTVVTDNEHKTIRFGLLTIKNIGEHIVEALIEEREKNGLYKNLEDILKRINDRDLNKKSVEGLTKSGALDNFEERGKILGNIEKLLSFSKSVQREKESGQKSLFTGSTMEATLTLDYCQPINESQKLLWEKEYLGVYISKHPIEDYIPRLQDVITFTNDISKDKSYVTVAGVISSIKKIITKKQQTMLFVNLEDHTGHVEIIVFPKTLTETYNAWQIDNLIAVRGKVSDKDDSAKILAENVFILNPQNIEQVRHQIINSTIIKNDYGQKNEIIGVSIKLPQKFITDQTLINQVKKVFEDYPGNSQVYLIIQNGNDIIKKVKTNTMVQNGDEFRKKINGLVGQNCFSN
ncbi:MAG: DNA polymerase III subunit alpha [Patescibacteria group bacterium]